MPTILITGASTGIGHATARYFHEQGWSVAATMRRVEMGAELGMLERCEVLRLDVTDRGSIDAAVAQTIEAFAGIDVVLNNAGYGLAGPLEAASADQLERQYATNVLGPIHVMQSVLPHMRERGTGMLMNVTSIGGRIALPFNSLYHGTKFALEGISESLAMELEDLNIKVKLIEPGGVRTDFAGRSLDFAQVEGLTAYDEMLGKALATFQDPARGEHYSDPEDIARVIFEAATDGSDQLRYLAGADAKAMACEREELSDETYRRVIRERFGMK